MSNIEAVQATNDDASMCKMSAVSCGYWQDPYISYFAKYYEKKTPEINRGYYARVSGIKILIDNFLKITQSNCQIINLGAGFDTMFWNLSHEKVSPSNFIEIDFPAVVERKCYFIKHRKPLNERLCGDVEITPSFVHSNNYHLVSADLRSTPELENIFLRCNLNYSLPTLVITECVLVYMNSSDSSKLLNWFTSKFSNILFVNYEQVNMKDRFGSVMIQNLKRRQCDLLGVEHCISLDTQIKRYIDSGCHQANAIDMNNVYNYLPVKEVHKIEDLEMLDEREILSQLLHHYCISWGYKDNDNIGLEKVNFENKF